VLTLIIGCNNVSEVDKIAYISSNPNSDYIKTFKDLNLGILFDFNLKLTRADKSWVTIWVEGYSNGNPIEASQFMELSCGSFPNSVEEGRWALEL
jgi:hypothetical protein